MNNLTNIQYAVITDKMAELKTPEEFDAFAKNVLEHINPKDPMFQSLLNAFGMFQGIRQENPE